MKRFEEGVSLIEVVLVVMVIAFLVLLISNLPSSIATINKSRNTSIAKDIVGKKIDSLRKQTYSNLVNGTVSFSDSGLSSLLFSTATYEIVDCPSEICTNSEKAKKVKVSVSWSESGTNKSVEMVTLIGEGGVGQ